MRWEKLGRVFAAEGRHDWMRTHAAWPRATHLEDHVFRVFFASRDADNRSHIAFVDIDVRNPAAILSVSPRPVLSPGEPGRFDESGVIPCEVVDIVGRPALYYGGISTTDDGAFRCLSGLAYLDDDLRTATRGLTTPLLDPNEDDPGGGGVACVRRDEGRGMFRMWYESRSKGSAADGRAGFVIRHAVSSDGVRWTRGNEACIGGDDDGSYTSNPSVLIEGNAYRMWYSYKDEGRYRIGYAESRDGGTWVRRDDRAGLEPSADGWDGEEVAYPSVFVHGPDLFMLYNGNQYGRTGFGIARLAREADGRA